jgi:pilus assembly protein CpaB
MPKSSTTKKEGLVGRGVITPIFEAEAVLENRLAAPGAGAGLASIIPQGLRAVAVKVNEIVGVAGFVVPGMHVDVLISGVPPGPQAPGGAKVRTILQNIEVLSAGQNYQKDVEGKPALVTVVNLLVAPDQAEVLSLANNETKIQLVLRNPLDKETAKPPGIGVAALLGEHPSTPPSPRPAAPAPKPAPPAAAKSEAPPAVYLIEVINGAQRSEAKFVRRAEENQ